MDTLNSIFPFLLFGSFFLYIVETICTFLFFPALGRLGIKVYSINGMPLYFDGLEIGQQYETNHAKFIRVSKNSCIFRYRHSFLEPFTPLLMKGEIIRKKSVINLVYRVAVGPVFLAICLFGWCIGIPYPILNPTVSELILHGFGIVFVGLIFGSYAFVELKRTRVAISEITSFFDNQLRPNSSNPGQ
jgi:hypothetical protein